MVKLLLAHVRVGVNLAMLVIDNSAIDISTSPG